MLLLRNAFIVALLGLLVALTGCGNAVHTSCSNTVPTGCVKAVQIDYVNFINVHGTMYYVPLVGDSTLPPSLQGSEYAKVHFQVADHVSDPGYQTKDGDAAFLPIGTAIYQVIGYRSSFRLAAMWNGHLMLYEASDVPHAQTGADLLDIEGKVTRIGVLWNTSTSPGTHEQGSISDPAAVQSLVAAVLAAPLHGSATGDMGTQVFIAFHLRDGTETVRVFYPAAHYLAGLQVPDSFVQAFQPLLPPPTPVTTPASS